MNSEHFLPLPVQPLQPTPPNILEIDQPYTLEFDQPPNLGDNRPILINLMIIMPILVWIWFPFTILFWNHELFSAFLCLFGFCYLVHLCLYCIDNPIWDYLNNKISNDAFQSHLHTYFTKSPIITMKAQVYKSTERGQFASEREEMNFKYYSWKDISGTFHLDLSQTKKKPIYLLLQIRNAISFADPMTIYDYNRAKRELYWRNVNKGSSIQQTDVCTFEGYKKLMLVRIGEEDSCFFNKKVYIIMILLSFGLFFCLMFKRKSVAQEFIIRKTVSTRYNLLEGENSMKFSTLKPMVSINSNVYEYNDNEVGAVFEENKMAPPSAMDLEQAKMYVKDIPE